MGYPERDEEKEIVLRHGASPVMPRLADFGVGAAATRAELAAAREVCARILLTDPLADYIVDIVRGTRVHPSIETGASPRAAP